MKKKKKRKLKPISERVCLNCDLYKAPCRGNLTFTDCRAQQPKGE